MGESVPESGSPQVGRRNRIGCAVLLLVSAVLALGGVLAFANASREPEPVAGVGATATVVQLPTLTAMPSPITTSTQPIISTAPPLPAATATTAPTATAAPTDAPTAEPFLAPPTVAPTATQPTPLPTPQGAYSWTLKVPILMYHYVSNPPADSDKYRTDLSVSPEAFRDQLAYLAENGYETVDLYDLSLAITAKRELPAKPVVITLDDGYVDNYENAFPLLQEFGMSATFFVVTQFIDEGRAGYMTWDMVKEMAAAGMRIEPHSKTHPDLSGQERDYVIYEILGSQETIAAHIGYAPRYFCYPGGRYDEQTIQVLRELDFWGAVTTAGGVWHGFDGRYEWSRVRMRYTTTLPEFAAYVDVGDTVAGKPLTN